MDQNSTDIGSRLRLAREQRGLSLRDIAATTKISIAALAAIERNEFARLPAGVFRRAYVQAFAAEVGLDAHELAREYRAGFETEPQAEPPRRHRADLTTRLRLVSALLAVLAAIVGVGIWVTLTVERVPDPQPASVGWAAPDALEAEGLDDRRGLSEPDGVSEATFATDADDVRAPLLRLELRTAGPCWVSVVADGARVVHRLMNTGELALVEAHLAITLRVGDAGAVAYSLNGATGQALGAPGEAVTISLTRDSLGRL